MRKRNIERNNAKLASLGFANTETNQKNKAKPQIKKPKNVSLPIKSMPSRLVKLNRSSKATVTQGSSTLKQIRTRKSASDDEETDTSPEDETSSEDDVVPQVFVSPERVSNRYGFDSPVVQALENWDPSKNHRKSRKKQCKELDKTHAWSRTNGEWSRYPSWLSNRKVN